jgi:hypothetical protein
MHAQQTAGLDRRALAIADRFVNLMSTQDLNGVVELYAPTAAWEVHVPGWDERLTDRRALLALHQDFFGRDQFRIDRCQLLADGENVALNWDLGWRDRESGLPAASFQSHVFVIHDDRIELHRMYCAGVRVYEPAPRLEEEEG